MKYTKYSFEERIAYISLNRPEKRNALNPELVDELKTLIKKAENDTNVKVIILKGEGKAFCAGADLSVLKNMQTFSDEENLADSKNLAELYQSIYLSKKIIIAQIEGHAIAGGAGLATVCDFIFSVPEAKYGYTEVAIGFIPAIVSIFLIRKIGETKAKELLLTGNIITAGEARDMGIFNRIVPEAKIEEHTKTFALKLARKASQDSLTLTKHLISEVQSKPIKEAVDFASNLNANARKTPDCKKGIAAFLHGEKLTW
ncbi:MAG: enoyl-CoA hydratase/isomerase family protein [Bacteroidota bacterium]|nr:enoyl-CoA hydratase/isomerase family protein [Bacteroidota bacterium]